MLPNFFILGAPKCGTTALATYLSQHPSIFMCPNKEPFRFDTDLPKPGSTGEKAYEALFRKADPALHRAVGEASTSYLFSKQAVTAIQKAFPAARFIVMLRPPTDLVVSWHSQMVWSGQESILDPEEAWKAEPRRKEGKDLPASCAVQDHLFYSQWGNLGTQVERLLERVPRERVLFLLLEEMAADPKAVYERTLSFLGVPSDGRKDFPRVYEGKNPRWPSLQRLLRWVANCVPGLQARSGPLKGFLREWNSVPGGRPPLSPAFRTLLTSHYHPEVEKLSALLGRDLSHWSR